MPISAAVPMGVGGLLVEVAFDGLLNRLQVGLVACFYLLGRPHAVPAPNAAAPIGIHSLGGLTLNVGIETGAVEIP